MPLIPVSRALLPFAGALLLAAVSCRTAMPAPGAARQSYAAYAPAVIEVAVVAVSAPTSASDDDMRLTVAAPPLLDAEDPVGEVTDAPPELSAQYAMALAEQLEGRGYQARIVAAEGSLRDLLAAAGARGADALLVARYVPVTSVVTGEKVATETRRVGRNRLFDNPTTVSVDTFVPHEHRGLLLITTAQLLDTRTAALLFRSPLPTATAGEIPPPGTDLLEWGALQSEAGAPAVEPATAATRASQRALAGLPERTDRHRQVDEEAARRVAAVEGVEARHAWSVGATVGAGLARFPISLDIGPATVELAADTPRRFVLQEGALYDRGAYGAGLEVGYRMQRLVFYGHLGYRLLPGVSSRTYVRTDPDIARAFPVTLGPAHDLGLDLMTGYQRLLWPAFGVRAAAGPVLRLHYVDGNVPQGARLDALGFSLGAGVAFEPFVRLGAVELGLQLRASAGYNIAGDIYGQGDGGLRISVPFS